MQVKIQCIYEEGNKKAPKKTKDHCCSSYESYLKEYPPFINAQVVDHHTENVARDKNKTIRKKKKKVSENKDT